MLKQTISVRTALALCLTVLAAGVFSSGGHFRAKGPEGAPGSNSIVATFGNRSLTLGEVEKTLALPLYALDTQRHQMLQQATQRLIDERLLEEEAASKGVPLSRLLEDASESETIAKIANLPAPVKRLAGSQTTALDAQEQARIRQALIVSLRRKADVRMTLPKLEMPVLEVEADGDRRLGPDRAPITIVEFSDFQCPYCQQSVVILKELRQLYGDRIRLIYRDYPGPNHPHAPQAAVAARCAGEQGKFWEYHDLLFDRQSSGKGWDFVSLSKELGLQQSVFEGCLSSGRFREQMTKDLQDGLKLGVTSTPTFFLNGRPLVGAQPLANFQALINTLLAQQPLS
jgi:protein-disulfide isomerase